MTAGYLWLRFWLERSPEHLWWITGALTVLVIAAWSVLRRASRP